VVLGGEPVVFHLKSGDRIAGTVLSEGTNAVSIVTPWIKELSIPLEQIAWRETIPETTPTNAPATVTAPTPQSAMAAAATPALAHAPAPNKWHTELKLGVDLISGSKDQEIYYGQFALTLANPYKSDPSHFFRNRLEYSADYGRIDGAESANRMYGSDKMDFDFDGNLYFYDLAGGGYDEIRKIDLQYEVGPGVGCHVLRVTNLAANIECGLNYQYRDLSDVPATEAAYARVGQDVLWKMLSNVALTERAAVLSSMDEPDEMQLRLEANLSLGLVREISFNLTAIERYDTRPAPGVTKGEFQFRSSLGLAF
jgi:hypothetical protein